MDDAGAAGRLRIVSLDVLLSGACGVARLHIQIETIAMIAYLSSLAHGVLYLVGANAWGFPMGAVSCWGRLMILTGELSRCKGGRIACKAASGTEKPSFIVRTSELWREDALIKTSGDARDFVKQLEGPAWAIKSSELLSPLFVIASVVLTVLICVAEGGVEYVSAPQRHFLRGALSFGVPLAYAAPFRRHSRRLASRGGCPGWLAGVKLMTARKPL